MSTDTSTLADREKRLANAADWMLRLRDPSVTPIEIGQWMAWCDASPDNQRAFAEMQQLWQDTENVEAKTINPLLLMTDSYSGEISIARWRRSRGYLSEKSRRLIAALQTAKGWSVALAASLMIGAALFLTYRAWRADVVVVTETGQNERLRLADGSRVTIAAGSHLTTHYTDKQRDVFLERGEAFFEVAREPGRPFAVHAFGSQVIAIGTAFNVRAERGMLRVAVTHGAVQVGRYDIGDARTLRVQDSILRLEAGQQATVPSAGAKATISSIDTQQTTSWVSGTLRFVDEPLGSVVAAVNRYSKKPIEIVDGSLEDYRYTGTVMASRVDEWLRGLPDAFPIVVREETSTGVNERGVRIELALKDSDMAAKTATP